MLYYIGQLFYPLPPPPKSRTKPLRIICLGLPRSGTESLQKALQTLGYDGVSHGFDFWLHHANTSQLYFKLMRLQAQKRLPDAETLRTEYFDRTLSDKEATTDIPTVWFAEELLRAYPDAKVVLNRRRDVQAWKESFRASVLPMMRSWQYWLWSWFNAELFWGVWLTDFGHDELLFRRDFERNAEEAYVNHFEHLEEVLKHEKREFLEWSVEDGWNPLCQFLDRPLPDLDFPHGNTAAEFIPKLMAVDTERFRKAKRNAMITVTCLVAGIAAWVNARW